MFIKRSFVINSFNFIYRLIRKRLYFLRFLLGKQDRLLYVFSLHSTRPSDFSKYRNILIKINSIAPFINPRKIDDFFESEAFPGPCSMLTLDDGFNDNSDFSEYVLDPLNIKAIFFVIPYFLKNKYTSEDFLRSLYPNIGSDISHLPLEIFTHLNKEQIINLYSNGHLIGVHGFNHESATSLDLEKLKELTFKSKTILQELVPSVEHYCYPFGSTKHFSQNTNAILRNYCRYIYTGTRGFVSRQDYNSKIFKRHTISSHKEDLVYHPYSFEEVYFFAFNKLSYFPILIFRILKNLLFYSFE